MSTIDPIASIKAEAEATPLQTESNPRKSIRVDMPDSDPYFVHPMAKLRYAQELWNQPITESPLYDRSDGYLGREPVQTLNLAPDVQTEVYEAAEIEDVYWGEVKGSVTQTFLGLATDPMKLLDRALELDLEHITPEV